LQIDCIFLKKIRHNPRQGCGMHNAADTAMLPLA
jgi:hypothetical protein